MPIRSRSISTDIVPPSVDNVNNRHDDARGTFDPKKDAITGSYIEKLCGEDADADTMRGVIGTLSFNAGQRGEQHAPTDLTTHNLLANMRIMYNPGENVERTYRNRIRSPLTGIRGVCVITCKSGSPKAVARCTNLSCPLWPFRMGKHGLR